LIIGAVWLVQHFIDHMDSRLGTGGPVQVYPALCFAGILLDGGKADREDINIFIELQY